MFIFYWSCCIFGLDALNTDRIYLCLEANVGDLQDLKVFRGFSTISELTIPCLPVFFYFWTKEGGTFAEGSSSVTSGPVPLAL